MKGLKYINGAILTISQLLLILFSNAQGILKPGAGPGGLSAYSNNQVHLFSTFNNQAALAQVKKKSAGLYAERKYLLEGLNNYLAAGAIETRSGCFGLELGYFGFSRFNQIMAGLAYALKLGSRMDAGIQFNYNTVRIPGYGSASAIGVEVATVFHLTEKLHAGIQASNPAGGKFGRSGKEKLPAVYRGGIGYDASAAFFTGIEIVKEELMPVCVNAAFYYAGIPGIVIKGGFTSASSSWLMGIGYLWRSMRVEISMIIHPQLGITPGFLLLYETNPGQR
jgi:hypothetical protein